MLTYILLYSVIWICFHFGAGYIAYLLPGCVIEALPLVNRTYAWERNGKRYESLGIKAWKDRLPEAGDFFEGGFSKRSLRHLDVDYLARFALETSRAEFSHWLTWGLALTFFAWNPWQVGVAMLIYGAVTNIPFILIQRYNRARLGRALERLERRGRAAVAAREWAIRANSTQSV